MKKIVYILGAMFFFLSCDTIGEGDRLLKVEIPPAKRRVLLEDYTGMKCPNCPEAAKTAATLKEMYGDNLILVSVHAGPFAKPSGQYKIDLRSDAGTAYDKFFGFDKYPSGVIDRNVYNNSVIIAHDSWASALKERVQIEAPLDIKLGCKLNAETKEVEVTTQLTIAQDIKEKVALQLWILEDSITAMQLSGNEAIPDYVNRHVLRGDVNGVWGTDLNPKEETLTAGSEIPKKFTYQLKDEWKAKDCSIVAFVYKVADKSVLQANEISIISKSE